MNEVLDVRRTVAEYLKARFPDRNELRIDGLQQIQVGGSHVIYALSASWRDDRGMASENLIIRREPDMGVHNAYDIGRECEALIKLRDVGIPVPYVRCLERDAKVLGRPFVIMEKIEGERMADAWIRHPEWREQLVEDFASILATIHSINWHDHGLSFLGVAEHDRGFAEKEIDKWESVLERAQYSPYPALAELVTWLRRNIPRSEHTTVCHGDYSPFNAHVFNGRIAAMLDWEMVDLGDPLSDVAWACFFIGLTGMPEWDEGGFINRYERLTGIEVNEENLFFWKLLAHLKLSAITISGINAFLESENPTSMREVTVFNTLIPILQQNALRMLGCWEDQR
jgi:aminoglycoside phosphotransferase (APT) family kinase protein